jgi:hypothetical protein
MKHPALWPHLPVFLLVYLLAKWAAFRNRHLGTSLWERADRARALATRA